MGPRNAAGAALLALAMTLAAGCSDKPLTLPGIEKPPEFLAAFGGYGTDDAQLEGPVGIAAYGGFLYVADNGNRRIKKFTEDGTFVAAWSLPPGRDGKTLPPLGLQVDGAGNLYACDGSSGSLPGGGSFHLRKYSPDGDLLADLDLGWVLFPDSWVVDDDLNVYWTQANRLQKYNVFPVVKIDAAGDTLFAVGPGGAGDSTAWYPRPLCLGSDGNLYVVDQDADSLRAFEPDGKPLWTSDLTAGGRIAVDQTTDILQAPSGRLYLCQEVRPYLVELDDHGRVLTWWGDSVYDGENFSTPSAVAVGGHGDLFVVDHLTSRVLEFGRR